MRWPLAALLLVAFAIRVNADPPPDPLRLIPQEADGVFRIEPARLASALQSLPPLVQLSQFAAVREALDSTNARRLAQLIGYFEKELGTPWPQLLDQLGGGGIVIAIKFTRDNSAPVLGVIQSRDAELLRRAVGLARQVIDQELARNDASVRPKVEMYRGLEITQIGEAHYAVAGSAFLVSNKRVGVERGLDLHLDGPAKSLNSIEGPREAAKLLPPDPLASLWVNLKPLHESPEGKEIFKQPKSDIAQLIFFGELIDVVGRSPFLAAGLYRTATGLTISTRMPAGREATPEGFGLHLAPPDKPATLPPLEPANVLYSDSFYLDLGALWTQREKILTDSARKQIDQAERRVGRFLAGRKLSELLTMSGPYYRTVVASQTRSGYSRHPDQIIPALAFAATMRDPEFGQAMNAILRTAAFLAGTQFKLKLTEETIDGVKLVGYRFPEDATVANDLRGLRYSFSPCFASVGEQFFAASTIELGREMVRLLKATTPASAPPTTLISQSRIYAAGGAVLAGIFEDRQVTQAILERAVSVEDAKKEARAFIDWLRGLGVLSFDTDIRANEFRFDIRWDAK